MKATNILLIVGLFCSCARTEQADSSTEIELKDSNTKPEILSRHPAIAQLAESETTDESTSNSDVNVFLQFDKLTMVAVFEEGWNDANYFSEIHNDTILVELGLVSKISGQTYSIKLDSSIRTVEIFQNYETSLTVMNEGPHVDLTEWRHYVGEWNKLEIKNGKFKTIEYTTADQEKFPDVTSDEIMQAVKKHLNVESNGWTELARKCTDANQYPCGVSISRINLRIILTDLQGIKTEKYLIFEIPMGC